VKEDEAAGKEEEAAVKEDEAAGKEEEAAVKEEEAAGKEEEAAVKEEEAAVKEEEAAGKEEEAAVKEEINQGYVSIHTSDDDNLRYRYRYLLVIVWSSYHWGGWMRKSIFLTLLRNTKFCQQVFQNFAKPYCAYVLNKILKVNIEESAAVFFFKLGNYFTLLFSINLLCSNHLT
jgi:flagellar biosynthesis GTPase FlhF